MGVILSRKVPAQQVKDSELMRLAFVVGGWIEVIDIENWKEKTKERISASHVINAI